MTRHIVRIGPPWLRIPLLCLNFPFHYALFAVDMLLHHPERHRLRELDMWLVPVNVFWAAWDGHFVPDA